MQPMQTAPRGTPPWQKPQTVEPLPTNSRFAHVCTVEELGPSFLRVTVEADDFSSYTDAAIHFRLVLPNASGPTAWPTVAANGSIKWAEGPDAPHRPVYTTRWVNHGSRQMAFDIFVHEGGRTTDWAQQIMAGNQTRATVGLVGPSGGGLTDANHVLFGADETGFPAAARLLENLPETSVGTVFLEAESPQTCAYPIQSPAGVELHWRCRSRGERLGPAVKEALSQHPGALIWFAGERSQALKVRDAALQAGWTKESLRVSGFWRASEAS